MPSSALRATAITIGIGVLTACAPAPPAPAADNAPKPAATAPAEAEITAARIAAHTRMLSSDLFEGRAPATRGGNLATEYLATQLALAGFEPAGDQDTFFQQVPVVESTVDRSFTL